jgi:hypothetical protein
MCLACLLCLLKSTQWLVRRLQVAVCAVENGPGDVIAKAYMVQHQQSQAC